MYFFFFFDTTTFDSSTLESSAKTVENKIISISHFIITIITNDNILNTRKE